jgi:1-acyl-sn-glycerol-3-phosphate acyltransferase
MSRIMLVGKRDNVLAEALWKSLQEGGSSNDLARGEPDSVADSDAEGRGGVYVYVPGPGDRDGMTPDLGEAERLFQRLSQIRAGNFFLISSALIYGTGPGRQAFVEEQYTAPGSSSRISNEWRALETLACSRLQDRMSLIILRPSLVLPSASLPARLLSRRFVPTLPGHDPVMQLLSASDLAGAILCAARTPKPGIYNVAPDTVVPLHRAIQLAGRTRLPFPRRLQRTAHSSESLDYLRYPWTVSNQKIKRELGFIPQRSSAATLMELKSNNPLPQDCGQHFDEFGMDPDYIRFYSKTLFRLVSDFYWRIEDKGVECIPARGPALLVGVHRGFMPFDGVMALNTVVRRTGRIPRFLTHPALLKFPFLANFMTKLGGVVACQESADRVLESGEMLGIFPEGIHGAFTLYRDAYKLHAFGRDAFVKLALRHRAPIVPFVTVGSAEIFPIFARIRSRRWTNYAGWPFIPITPTFPLLPVPLPSKWHTLFLPPVHVENYPPEAADDPVAVKTISREVRARMQQAFDSMRSLRKSIFFGSIFERAPNESQGRPEPV